VMDAVLTFFDTHALPYRLYTHSAFFTVADAQAYMLQHGEVHTAGVVGCKNLFLKNYVETKPSQSLGSSESRYYLYVLPDVERADLKAFAAHVGEKKVTFGSPEELMQLLGVTPGSVSLCGLLNDLEKKVAVYIHEAVSAAPLIHLHPNINTASIEISHDTLVRYMGCLGRTANVVTSSYEVDPKF
jgi:Ala-tRNA(Pro) deacylase